MSSTKSSISRFETILQFIKFAIVGFVNTGIHYAVFIVLFRVFGFHYLAATSIGYCCGMLNSFVLNKRWTFALSEKKNIVMLLKFVLINLIALYINNSSLNYFVRNMKMAPEIGQIFSIAFSMVVNFLGNKYWTFRRPVRKGSPEAHMVR